MDLLESNSKVDINSWYYYSKFKLSLNILSSISSLKSAVSAESAILADIGAGSGVFTKAFLDAFTSPHKKAYAIDTNYKEVDLGFRDNVYFCHELPKGIKPNYFFFMDVLEHVESDVDFLNNWVESAPKGSIFLITVPAFKCLWSNHDLFLKHKKRYSLKELEKVISAAGLDVLKSSYFYASIFPFVFLKRKILEPLFRSTGFLNAQGIKPANKLSNFILKTILSLEINIYGLNRLFGLTCIAVAKKK